MPQFVQLSDQLVNIDNVVALDVDQGNVVRIWFVGSPTPLQLERPVPANRLVDFLRARGLLA